MPAEIVELYPPTGARRALDGTYLAHDLRALGTAGAPFVYANFVSSLDGRIAVVEAHTKGELFHTLTAGPRLGPAGRLQLHTLYYDAAAPKGTGQWFASFDVRQPVP